MAPPKLPPPSRPPVFTPFFRRFTDERTRELQDTETLYRQVTIRFRASSWAEEDAIVKFCGRIFETTRERAKEARSNCDEFNRAVVRLVYALVESEAYMFETLTHWYAPAIGANVKEITVRTREHSQGYARFVAELVEYEAPK